MRKSLINPEDMTTPLSKYSQGVKVDLKDFALIFVTCQLAIDTKGKLVGEGNITRQAEFVCEELRTILESSESSLGDVVKSTIFTTDMSQYPKAAEVINRYFADSQPASAVVEVSRLAEDGCLIGVEVTAITQKLIH